MELDKEIKKDILETAGKLGPLQIVEGLKDLLTREKILYNKLDDNLMKEVSSHSISVLVAAITGYEMAVKDFGFSTQNEEPSPQTEETA